MKTKSLLTKVKLLLALFAFIIVTCNVDENTQFVVQEHADIQTTISAYDQNVNHEPIESYNTGKLLVDIEMDDGFLGWCPVIYERQQAA